jgi:hypothetical protein
VEQPVRPVGPGRGIYITCGTKWAEFQRLDKLRCARVWVIVCSECLLLVCLEVTWFDMSYTLARISLNSYDMSRV